MNLKFGKISLATVMLTLGLHASDHAHSDNTHKKQDTHATHTSHWSYSGNAGPDLWGNLQESYQDCKNGKRQSPINIVSNNTIKENSLGNLYFDYKDAKINIINNGHTIQVNSDNTSYSSFQGKKFKLLQFHFHSLSEHTVNGKNYPMEAHLVHQADDGELAVVGIFLKVGKYNQTMQKVFKLMPKNAGQTNKNDNFSINANDLLPKDRNYYHYLGSLTTPPCTQIVEWYVMKQPIEISDKQLEEFQRLYKGNYRPVCDLNNRKILEK